MKKPKPEKLKPFIPGWNTDDAARCEAALREYLEAMVKIRKQMGKPDWCAYAGGEDFLLQHGEWFRKFARPKWIGATRACYGNAIVAAVKYGLTYVEGYATAVIPVHHAWCVDGEGRVHEVTWPMHGGAYCGVRFHFSRADESTWDADATVLSDPRREHSVLAQPWTGEDWQRVWPESPRIAYIREGDFDAEE